MSDSLASTFMLDAASFLNSRFVLINILVHEPEIAVCQGLGSMCPTAKLFSNSKTWNWLVLYDESLDLRRVCVMPEGGEVFGIPCSEQVSGVDVGPHMGFCKMISPPTLHHHQCFLSDFGRAHTALRPRWGRSGTT